MSVEHLVKGVWPLRPNVAIRERNSLSIAVVAIGLGLAQLKSDFTINKSLKTWCRIK
jgi:hypothetical protein